MENVRNLSFDLLKGFLIILVITGHILPGNANEGLRGIIYYSHMPLFLGVTGYFIKSESLNLTVRSLIKKYNIRMITPYLVAFIIYTSFYMIFSIGFHNIQAKHFIGSVIFPFYHLWYIPAVIIFILYTKVLNNNLKATFAIFFLSSILTIVWYADGKNIESSLPLLRYLGDKRFYYYYSFFLIGFMLGNDKLKVNTLLAVALCLATVSINIFFNNTAMIDSLLWYIFNASLISLLITSCNAVKIKNKNILVKIGQNSLPIYLWHVAAILTITYFISPLHPLYYISIICAVIILTMFFVLSKGKSKFIDKYFYGESRK
ncbi:TPA: acyltransferase [Klebsiella pneumoniae]|uniref:acyltransferase family protein n=1 Tax=Klebsiella pneumoniae TaxID=573 RepID=UPI00106D71B2|nr:acyltransferase family protein [Klebsiella pneumoniae]UMD86809.1 acyltransferase family protein [Klebsiella pneumoniae]VFT27488.1 Fucose 4-O-acetylase and related acetyltransferases [Klebsiella pneumoniae]HBZ1362649.1 acyltransferase [Klebsiella pneumoniae]